MSPKKSPGTRFAALPETISRAPDAAELEILAGWEEQGVFAALQVARAEAPAFVFWEGPPTANGRPGIHHMLSRTIKDTVCRQQSMLGKRVDRKAGWDTHGLPVELEVEKTLGISGKPEIEKYGIAEFNAKCRESVWTYRQEWEELSNRIGFWLDYEHPYATYDEDFVESVWYILKKFHDGGLVYRGKRVVHFCGRCGTGLSAHEVGQPGVYQDVVDPSVTVRFPVLGEDSSEPLALLAWTTTPWTLPSNVALAVHPAVEYIRARVALPVAKGAEPGSAGHEQVWLAAARANAVLGEDFEVLETVLGAELEGRRYSPPFEDEVPEVDPGAWQPDPARLWTVISADYVSTSDGTGIVHQAPSYGVEDWGTAGEYRLPVRQAVGTEGRLVVDVAGVRAGTFFKDTDKPLIRDLNDRGRMFKATQASHSYPHCWRCDTALMQFATPAWYIRTSSYKQRMMDYNSRCNWVPREVGEKRFENWLENNIDWNISRDRYWGTPLPFWVCEDCDAECAAGSRAEIEKLAGGLPEGFDNHKPVIDEVSFACTACGGVMRRTRAVLDCWFDSGSMPYAQHHFPFGDSSEKTARAFPADFIAEGLDQTRGWFYSLIAIGAFLAEEEPALPTGAVYKSCVVNGMLLDRVGQKMSKSRGNALLPFEAIREHGVDAWRWYLLSSSTPGEPLRVEWLAKEQRAEAQGYKDGVLDVRRRFLGTLLNSYKFFAEYARIDGFDPVDPDLPAAPVRPEIDRWLLSRTQTLIVAVRRSFAEYDLSGACQLIERFVVDELSNWYIRRNRRRFWKGETGADKLAAYASLHTALSAVTLLIAPVVPFVSEILWQRLGDSGASVHLEFFPEADEELVDEDLEKAMQLVERVILMGRALRERAGRKVRQPLRSISVRASDAAALELLAGEFATEQVLEELNIKAWGSLDTDDGKLCRLRAKANFKVLGRRLGSRMKAAAALILDLDSGQVARLRDGESVTLELDGEELAISPDEVTITVESSGGLDVESDGRVVVFLDAELDRELLAEGLAREVISRVNALRKDRGLAVEQRIALRLDADGELLEQSLAEHAGLIAGETLTSDFECSEEPLPDAPWEEYDLGEGLSLRIALAAAE
ncbi:MAG: isoleucine--tRNA ligase [bacterium]|nr:isoleucine--tRNA ligase [Planctomycetota bacterium]HIL52229.1 isoleucine--tRNA ligase [Planctomycetota bacterium]